MKRLKLVFGTSNSQPVGTDEEELERVYQRAYKPFIRTLYNFADIPITLHYSGALFHWLEKHHAEFLDVLAEMGGRRQIEFLGGGFYEPVLPMIPHTDRIGQIEQMTTFVRKRFGRRPRGTWITELVWEPSLPSALKNSGMEYTFLADYHFISAGLSKDALYRPCITEDQGKTVVVFPICKRTRWKLLSETPEAVIDHLRELADEDPQRVVVMLDEGERFGLSEDSYRVCYDEQWLERFLTLVSESSDWLEPIHPGRYLKQTTPRKRAYFPATSYEDMMCWVLPVARQKAFQGISREVEHEHGRNGYVFGGFFRQFLTRYPESNLMYAKMQYTHILVNQIRGDKYRKQAAREELWKGQSHHAYWHGRPGGIYLNQLRKQVYTALIEAEKVTREKGIFIPSIVSVDFDMDGLSEYLYQGQEMNAYVHTQGGVLFELDYLPVAFNYLDTLSRQLESYHDSEISREGYDRYLRKAFVDHFFAPNAELDAFSRMCYQEHGSFLDAVYVLKKYDREEHWIQLQSDGSVGADPEDAQPVRLEKRYSFQDAEATVMYRVTNSDGEPLNTVFGVEVNVSPPAAQAHSARVSYIAGNNDPTDLPLTPAEADSAREVRIYDEWNRTVISYGASKEGAVWSMPVSTYAMSHEGVRPEFQQFSLVYRWPLALEPNESWELTLRLGCDRF